MLKFLDNLRAISNRFTTSKVTTILLILIIYIGCALSDRYLINSFLSIPLFLSTAVAVLIIHWAIPKLKNLNLKQIIRVEGPEAHKKKSGTPTMGGLLVIPIGLIMGNLINVSGESSVKVFTISCLVLSYMLIGGLDDWKSLTNNTNKGLSAKAKLFLQSISGIIFLIWSGINQWIPNNIALPLGINIQLGILIWPLALFVLLAESNATNLTDGLDGLASGCGALVFTGLGIQLIIRGNNGDPVLAGFCIAMAGSWIGFLIHNRNPAKVFMGDTGSLAMGAALSGVALISNSLWPLLIMGGIFLAESLSVIIQVLVFKFTKRIYKKGHRVLLMAPLHHHYELMGIPEELIVRNFWLVTISLILLGLLIHPTY